ncbi:MAG TPA: chemotaxis protein CheW [Actinophytocola sp.]|uniref:chemotaxis protein CheW n=1 Tax=Actinophytocola sp. TaxID=1872138 RepID=UPI002DB693E6|nr:chemotaxis protein CheW [Actinophytocola sp.]HEU5474245.1 chemotaxis protein CheW [Actinophytocola sp.]
MDEIDDVVQEFLVESYENLDQLDRDLVALEKNPTARDKLASIFRTIHTIKGTSGFLAFNRLEQLTHAGESLLARLRDGTQLLDRPSTDVLLQMIDKVRALLAHIEQDGTEGTLETQQVIDAVNACIAGVAPSPAPAAAPAPAEAPQSEASEASESDEASDEAPADEAQADDATEAPAVKAEGGESAARRSVADTSVRVDVDLLDKLMRLVGELVLTRNQMVRAAETANEQNFAGTAQRLNIITSELQEGVMKTRMQPIKNLWSKLPRVVRDLAVACGREVRLEMEGADTELDRSLLESVKDPLTHLVRNAVDHGIEPPEDRAAAGKPREGTLTLRAYHEHGQVIVEVADDGGGIHPDRVGATAVKRGVVTQTQLDAMDDEEILKLVFRPGFSTANQVSNVSGRGVGMDVVRTNLEAIGGAVDLRSVPGEGTTWRLTIPLTLAIVQALMIESGDQRYAVPQMAVHELVYVDGQGSAKVEYVSGAPVYRLRGKLLPLVRLGHALGGEPGGADQEIYVAVLKGDGHQFGLVVDRVLNTEEVVVKPLAARFKDVGCYAGATILGDGRVSLILDVQALARRSQLGSLERTGSHGSAQVDEQVKVDGNGDRLLINKVADRRVAIPLSMVTRLEEFPVASIERVGSREVVQYRGEILPVLRLAQLLGAWSETESATVPAIVYTDSGRSVALAVDEILDIVEDAGPHSGLHDDGLNGSAVIQDQVTELLDVRQAILAADPSFFIREDHHAERSAYLLEA